jgi:hypothetical protein
MNDSDKQEFATLMYGAGELYDKQISKTLLQIYFKALESFSIESVSFGLGAHTLDAKSGSFFPKPADIVRHINANQPSAEERAELAWIQIESAIARIGSYGNLNMEDKQALAAVKALGSWSDLCKTNIDKMAFKKKEFLAIYKTYENTPLECLPNSLPGRHQLEHHKTQDSNVIAKLKDMVNQKHNN